MVDFLMISTRPGRRGIEEIYPRFIIKKSSDLMIRGGDFYAVWLEDEKRWSTEKDDVISLIDNELYKYYEEHKDNFEVPVKVLYLRDSENGMIDRWNKYCKQQMFDTFHMLDEKLIFSNTEVTKKDYSSKRLPYPLEDGDTSAYDELMSTLYSEEERRKIEWCIGAVVTGDSKKLQKFMVLYGAAGTGKSTVLNIIQQLFDGYYSVFDAKSLTTSSNSFALEAFKSNPLVAIQHDGDLSRIEDNTRLNSLVSHEMMEVNEKFKSTYQNRFKAFLFMGTNNPVKITDAKSGLMRRLIDVTPTGEKLSAREYKSVTKQIGFELGAIAWHCKEVYESDPGMYDNYIPSAMLEATNDLYNFMEESYLVFKHSDGVALDNAWRMYKEYCNDSNVAYPLSKRVFREQLRDYFLEYRERTYLPDGSRPRSYYSGFITSKFRKDEVSKEPEKNNRSIEFLDQVSVFDTECCNFPAQYASDDGVPLRSWDKVTTRLADIDTSKLHYVFIPEDHKNHIVIDFDIPGDDGEKSFERNLEEASKWPATYAELSKSGKGIHLHYIYDGDVSRLSRVYADHIEIKVFNGNSSLRRKLTLCNALPIAKISSGLPLQEEKKKTDGAKIKSQKKLLEMIERNLNKEIHGSTKPSCDFIYKIVEDAYNDGFKFSIPHEMRKRIMAFARNSTNQSDYCVKLMKKMHYESKDLENAMDSNNKEIRDFIYNTLTDGKFKIGDPVDTQKALDVVNECLLNAYNSGMVYDVRDVKDMLTSYAKECNDPEVIGECLTFILNMHYQSNDPLEFEEKPESIIIFYDIEVFPNLLVVVWKAAGDGKPFVRMINPTPEQIDELMQFRLVGFNCRRYDNHIIYARSMGYTNEQCYILSQRIINGEKDCFFGEAYNISYTDIYDFASAGNKKSLKKLEIEMGIHHQELGLPWDKPVPEDKWDLVAEYCENDVMATEAAFTYLNGDWTARQILSDITELTANDTTNSQSTRLIFGKNRTPQNEFEYRDLSKPVKTMAEDKMRFLSEACPDMMSMTHGAAHSLLPYFPGYKKDNGISTYRGEEVGEGGYVCAEPGMYIDVALLDIASMHPHSTIAECLFGVNYTKILRELVLARIYIKHEQWSKAEKVLGGKLKPYIQKIKDGVVKAKDLSNALKTVINSVYGLTSAAFPNPFKDPRNIDNIVAKRGALFMVDLKHAVQEKGFTVAHIKTDSIKIPNATPEIIQFVMDFGKQYGYTFEHEATYEKMCLVNDAVYIAKYKDGDWTATGTQFAVPYVFKTLFSKEEIIFDDLCETKSVKTAIYLDDRFIGKVGQFTPVLDGGHDLLREQNGKMYSVVGTKGYKWQESEIVRSMDWKNVVDLSYYKKLVDEAVRTMAEYGDVEWFLAT